MHQTGPFNQNAFTGALPPPNDTGVCFSLSLTWLVNHCQDVFVESLGSEANNVYAIGSNHSANLVQNAANWIEGQHINMQMLIGLARDLFPAIGNVLPVNGLAQALTPGNLTAQMGAVPYQSNLIWLINPMNRGHIVAFHTNHQRFFDANSGFYNVGANMIGDIVAYVTGQYAAMPRFMVYSLNI